MSDNTASNEAQFEVNPETEETGAEETNTQEGLPEGETNTENKGQSKAAKLLAQRNEARREADELKSRLDNLENRFKSEDEAKNQGIKDSFKASYGEEALEQAESVLNQHSSLSIEQAYQLAGGTLQKNPTRFSTPGRTPADINKDKGLNDLSIDELTAAADAELRGMLGR